MNQSRKESVDRNHLLTIQLVGGPYDGHQETRLSRAELLPQNVVWFVGEDVFRTLDGISPSGCHRGTFTSVAIYLLECDAPEEGETFRYRFTGAVSVNQIIESISTEQE